MSMPIVPPEQIRNLPLPDLAMVLLRRLGSNSGQVNSNNVLRGLHQSLSGESDRSKLTARIADAWAWLQSRALLAPHHEHPPTGNVQQVTELGRDLLIDPNAITKMWAAERLSGDLDPLLASAQTNFALGDYETAAFAAMKAVEVEVRRVAGLSNDSIGVPLMRKAFRPQDGVLRDPQAEAGEQQAVADLFAGAIGAYKNPASHRTVQFDDPVEAAEIIQLADLLLRIVRRSADRIST